MAKLSAKMGHSWQKLVFEISKEIMQSPLLLYSYY